MENQRDTSKPKILVTLIEAGMGHIVSANAISEALKQKYRDKVEIIDKHILRDSDNEVLREYEKYIIKNVQLYSKSPTFGYLQYASMYLLGPQNSLKFVHSTVLKKEVRATVEEYAKIKPDVIICTHFFATHCAIMYKKECAPDVLVVSYCPDNNIHGWWDVRGDMMYTNNPMATRQAYQRNYKSGCVYEAFYPTRKEVMETNESKEFYRNKFGIPQDKFAVVVADGAYAMAKSESVCLSLMESDLPLTICFLAGKNEELKAKFDKLKQTVKPNITLLTFGFLSNAPELYRACDLFITKSGPNAILDSVMVNTPIIIDYCATPIEVATKNLFVKHFSCGYFMSSPSRIKKQVEKFIENPKLLDEFSASLQFFDKSKNGAEKIADDIIEMLFNPAEHRAKRLAEEDAFIDSYIKVRQEKACKIYRKELQISNINYRRTTLQKTIKRKKLVYRKKSDNIKKNFHSGKDSQRFARILVRLNENSLAKEKKTEKRKAKG
ncbi:MAG: hypothetical protein NC350_03835 [Corallococcus sp.]|nr:hypothetical protein [Corallococcus sp.]